MKFYLLIYCLMTYSVCIFASVVQPSDDSLADDLSYKLSHEYESKRKIASDNDQSSKSIKSKKHIEKEREIASDIDKQDSKIQYWKFED